VVGSKMNAVQAPPHTGWRIRYWDTTTSRPGSVTTRPIFLTDLTDHRIQGQLAVLDDPAGDAPVRGGFIHALLAYEQNLLIAADQRPRPHP
jgi:hypothetical protein